MLLNPYQIVCPASFLMLLKRIGDFNKISFLSGKTQWQLIPLSHKATKSTKKIKLRKNLCDLCVLVGYYPGNPFQVYSIFNYKLFV